LLAGAVGLFAHPRRLAVVLALVEGVVACAGHGAFGTSEVRIALAKLLLRGGDQAVVMFGVLEVVLGRDRITGRLRVARKLHVLFSDVRGVSAYFDVRAVRLVDPRHGIVTFTVASAHALVLTVSHDSPVCKSLHYGGPRRPAFHQLPNYSRRERRGSSRTLARSSRKSQRRHVSLARQGSYREVGNPCHGLPYRGVAHSLPQAHGNVSRRSPPAPNR
jgi:hypothetical protein